MIGAAHPETLRRPTVTQVVCRNSVTSYSYDLLFIDTRHTAAQLTAELERHARNVRRRIVLHDTQIFGERGEDGGPGLLVALRAFLKANPEWSVIHHTQVNHGLTVISWDKADKPALPGRIAPCG